MTDVHSLAHRRAQLSAAQLERLQQRLRGAGSAGMKVQRMGPSAALSAPLSAGQKRLWFLWQLDPGDAAYHLGTVLKLRGALNEEALQFALDGVVARHEALRSVFSLDGSGAPVQQVQPPRAVPLTRLDLRDAPDSQRAQRALASAQSFHEEAFDLARGPLLRAQCIRLNDAEHWLVIVMHHIAGEAWSKRIIVADFGALYNARARQRPCEPPPVPLQYCDYVYWEQQWCLSPEREHQLAFWRAQLTGAETLTQLPTDKSPRADARRQGGVHRLELGASAAYALARFAQAQRTSLFTVLLTGFFMLLQRYTGQRDLSVGVPVANRHLAEMAGVVGFFVNTQVLRCKFGVLDTSRDWLSRVRETVLNAQAHQDLPFDQLVQALHPGGGPGALFRVMFNHLKEEHAALQALQGLELCEYVSLHHGAQFDVSLDTLERADGTLVATFTYDAGLFEAETIACLASHYRRALEWLVTNSQAPLHRLDLLAASEHEQLRQWGEAQADEYEPHSVSASAHEDGPCAYREPIHHAFERHAQAQPHATALCFREQNLSYGEINRRANQLAHRLCALGVVPETVVGIALERSFDMVIGLLAILKAGAAYVPLDPEYPPERLAYMAQSSGVRLLLTHGRLRDGLPRLESLTFMALDEIDCSEEPECNPQPALHGEMLAYVIYTSGSTGRPKGAANRHRALSNRIAWMQQAYALTSQDVVLQKTPFSFDVSVWEFFWPLAVGARLVIAEPGAHRDPARLIELIRQHGVTTLHFVPAMLQVFLAQPGSESCSSFRRVVCSGEALPLETQRQAAQRWPQATLHNLYGPTEAAIDVTHWTCVEQERGHVPIGGPITGIRTYVLDDELNRVPVGVPGELYLGGIGLARGYQNRPGLTAERFVADPCCGTGERLYRTGDRVRWSRDGKLAYLGRIDSQVKIRGQRIELGEIEAQLLSQPGVREAAVVAKHTPAGTSLVAYVCAEAGQALESNTLREALKRLLPEYMLPSGFVLLKALPVNPSGKIDRKALPDPDPSPQQSYEAPQGEIETTLAQLWSQLLNVERVGRHDHFFALGGHSLLVVQMVARVQAALRVHLSIQDVFQEPTLGGLATHLANARTRQTLDDALAQIDGFIDEVETV